jgi:Tfp pilus assembly ATPase PilU
VCQRLVEKEDGSGRIATLEILVNNARAADAIAEGRAHEALADIIADSEYYGMQSFEMDLIRLVKERTISIQTARAAATNLSDFDVALRRLGLYTEQRSNVSVVA